MTNGKTKLDEVSRRGFLAGMLGLAAQGIVPKPVAAVLTRELNAPAAAAGRLSVPAGLALFQVIRDQLGQYDAEDDDEYYEARDQMAADLGLDAYDDDGNNQLDDLLDLYHSRDRDAAAQQLMQHLQQAKIDPNTITVKPRDDWRYHERIKQGERLMRDRGGNLVWVHPDPLPKRVEKYRQKSRQKSGQDLSQAIDTAASTVGRGQATAMAGATIDQFRDLVQRVMSAGQTSTAPGEPRVRDMGRIEPTSSAPALPAPDRSAAEIMRDLQDRLDRPLTDQEKVVVQQEITKDPER